MANDNGPAQTDAAASPSAAASAETPEFSSLQLAQFLAYPEMSHEGFSVRNVRVRHYQLVEVLGVGGMGVVVKARDDRLDRGVVLKFLLRQDSATPESKERFVVEARAASALDHPNICTIHEISETSDGHVFIVMAYYDGETLQGRLARGSVPVREALELTLQIGRGLAAAHRKGIVHRDIKPSNVIVTVDGVAKIIDFGVAKLTSHARLTRTGGMVGTLPYMAPEQARADVSDARSDVWALGTLFYELISARSAFERANAAATTYAIQYEEPAPLRALRPELPDIVDSIVVRALRKRPEERYQNAGEMVTDLEHAFDYLYGAVATSDSKPPSALLYQVTQQTDETSSIVVLPFNDLSPDQDQGHFSQGLTEEITTALSKIASLRVISRTSAMIAQQMKKDMKSIRTDLNVRYVVEGTVRKAEADESLRITVQLIDAARDAHIWSERYTGTISNVFEFEEKIAKAIVESLKVTLSPDERRVLARHSIPDVHAFECYLKARHDIYSWTEDGLNRALQHLDNGIDIVGENALLLAGLGFAHLQFINAGIGLPEEHLTQAIDCVERITQLDPASQHGFRLRGLLSALQGDQQQAATNLARALESDPNDVDALVTLSLVYGAVGRSEAALPLAGRLLQIDPLTPINYWIKGWLFWTSGREDLAIEPIEKMYRLATDDPMHRLAYANILAYNGRTKTATEVFDLILQDTPETIVAPAAAFMKHALAGDLDAAESAITPAWEAKASVDWFDSWILGSYFARLNATDRALHWVRNAIQLGFINYPFLATHDRFLSALRDNEEYQQLMSDVREKWENFAV